jgi:hypothetical protein
MELKPEDKIILVDFGTEIYSALIKKKIQPVFLFHKKKSGEKVPSDPRILDFHVIREARFEWPIRQAYLQSPQYQHVIDAAIQKASEHFLYLRFFSRDQGEGRQFGRRGPSNRRWSWAEMHNQMYKSLYYFLDLLVRNRINKIFFSDIPHEGAFVLLYFLAQAMDIDCIVCVQSQFPNRFFISKNASFGSFFDRHHLQPAPTGFQLIAIPKVERPFYMKGTNVKKPLLFERTEKLFKLSAKVILLTWVFRPHRFKHAVSSFSESLKKLPRTRDSRFTMDTAAEEKYVYFPLHLQPEMTTDSLGGQYGDQLLAIEKLRGLLPEDWVIYCKENPKQAYFMREEGYYERLTSIPNLKIVHITSDSYKLIQNSQFVATITGTAGWEALRMGKKVLLYGDAWYKDLTGVYHAYSVHGIDQMMLDNPINPAQLKADFENLCGFLHAGVAGNKIWSVLVEDFDDAKNGTLVAQSLIGQERQ